MARYQIEVITTLRNPNTQGFLSSYEQTLRSLQQKATAAARNVPAGQAGSPQDIARQARQALISTEVGIEGQRRAGALSTADATKLRNAVRRTYRKTIEDLEREMGVAISQEAGLGVTRTGRVSFAAIGRQVRQQIGSTPPTAQQAIAQGARAYNPQLNARNAYADETWVQANVRRLLRIDQDYIAARAALIDATNRLRLAEQRAARSYEDPHYQRALGNLERDRARNAAARRVGVVRLPGESDADLEARTIRVRRQQAAERNTRAIDQATRAQVDAEAADQAARRRHRRAVNRSAEVIDRQAREQESRGATFGQRILHRAHDRPGRNVAAIDEQLGTQFFQSRLLNTAAYGASAAIVYGFVNGLQQGIKEALELQRVTERLRAQFQALGEDPGAFRGFRSDLLAIARQTGQMGSEVAFVGLQMRGAFGDTELAVRRTAEAIRAAQVSGLSLVEVVDSLTAASISYDRSIDDITDKAIGLEQRFGVTAQQSIKSFGDISTVAQQAGLTIDEVGGILGVVQQRSGRNLAAITEGLSRVLPAVQERAADILRLVDQTPELGNISDYQNDIAAGRSGQVLLNLAQSWDRVGESTQNAVIQLLGGRREAQYLIPLFEGADDIMREVANAGQDAGKAAEYQAAQQRTLGYQIGRIREEINQLADSLGRLGLFQSFALFAAALQGGLGVLGSFVRVLADLNDAAGGIPGNILAIALAIRTLQRVADVQMIRNILGPLLGRAVGTGAGAGLGQGLATLLATIRGGGGAGVVRGAGGLLRTALGAVPFAGGSALAGAGIIGAGALALTAGQRFSEIQGQAGAGETRELQGLDRRTLETLLFQEQQARRRGRDTTSGVLEVQGLRGTVDSFLTNLPGGRRRTPYENLRRELGQRIRDRFEDAQELGFLDEDDPAIKDLQRGLEKGDGDAQDRALVVIQALSERQQQRLRNMGQTQSEVADAIANSGARQLESAELTGQQFARGEKSYREYMDALNHEIDILRRGGDATRAQMNQLIQTRNQAWQQSAQAGFQFATQLAQLFGQSQSAATITAARRQLRRRGLNPETRANLIMSLAQAEQQQLQERIDGARSVAEANTLAARGVQLEARFVEELVQTLISTHDYTEAEARALVTGLIQLDSARDRTEAAINEALAVRRAGRNPGATASQQASERISDIDLQLWLGAGTLTLTEQANLQAERNQAEYDRQQALRDEARELGEARRAVRQARAGSNDELLARLAVDAAREEAALARSGTEADRLRAEASRIEADRRVHDYVWDAMEARLDLLTAVAESNGDLAEVARLTLQGAEAELLRIRQQFDRGEADQADVDKAEAAAVRARATKLDQDRQRRIDDLEYLYEFDRITADAFIAALTEELNKIPESNVTARREIERRIRALRDEMGRDLQFNLPTEIRLGSLLYESRRLGSTPGMYAAAQTYVDNRRVSIVVPDAGDPEATAQAVFDRFNEPNRYGTYVGVYPGSGS